MTTIQMISLNALYPSPANVRKTDTKSGIESLAASIDAHGLLQNLTVQTGGEKGKFSVLAGGRRLAALNLLAKQKKIKADHPVPCNVWEGSEDISSEEISLAENELRTAMHPADQFDAFKKLADEGQGDESIAAKFGVSPHTVRQRLKLASVSTKLMEAFRAGDMTLEQVKAFTVSDDHEAQDRIWEQGETYNRNPGAIRRALTETQVSSGDERVAYVGLDAYKAAGGAIITDLFSDEGDSYLADPALLDKLVAERLDAESKAIGAEGWSGVLVIPDFDWEQRRQFEPIKGKELPPSEEAKDQIEKLQAEQDRLVEIEETEGGISDEQHARYDELSRLIDDLETPLVEYTAKQKKTALAIVTMDGVVRGMVRKGEATSEPDEDDEAAHRKVAKEKPTFSAKLLEDLTAHRTAAIAALLSDKPHVALAAVVHAMALSALYEFRRVDCCMSIKASMTYYGASATGIEEGNAEKIQANATKAATKGMPKKPEQLWAWLIDRTDKELVAILAVCAATTVDAIVKDGGKPGAHSGQLAEALKLDMTKFWEPTAESYFDRVSSAQIIEAVTEACGKAEASTMSGMKKADLSKAAERKMKGKGWLPVVLRAGGK